MQLLELISGSILSPIGGTFEPLIPNAPDTFQVRDFDITKSRAYIVGAFHSANASGVLRIRSPHFHDINGIQFQGGFLNTLMPSWMPEVFPELYPGETLLIDATEITSDPIAWGIIIYYEDVPGFKTKYVDLDFILKYKKRVFSKGDVIGQSITEDGTYQSAIAPHRIKDILTTTEFNRYYVLMSVSGIEGEGATGLPKAMGGLISIDWGNVKIPIFASSFYPLNEYFKFLSERVTPKIFPVFHSENVGQISTVLFSGTTGGDPFFLNYYFVELTQEANSLLDAMGEEIVTEKTRSLSQ